MYELESRECGHEGIDSLVWIKGDTGAWTGPLNDWIENRDKILKYVPKRGTVFQAGGCCGMYPRFYKQYFDHVFTVEPNPDNFQCLAKNCENIDGIHFGNYAVGSESKKVSMNFAQPGGDSLNMGMHTINMADGNIDMVMIDQFQLEALDLMHLDLEGFETPAIAGGLQTITRFWPVIVTERGNGADLLLRLGYKEVEKLAMDSIFVKQWW